MEKIVIPQTEINRRKQKSRERIRALALQESKHIQRTNTLFRQSIRSIQNALLNSVGNTVEDVLFDLRQQITNLVKEDIEYAITLASDILDDDVEQPTPEDHLKRYAPVIGSYVDTLNKEVMWYINKGLKISSLVTFLSNPLLFLTSLRMVKPFKDDIRVGRGKNYQVKKDLQKIGHYVLFETFYDSLSHGYSSQNEIVGYIGFRNGDYPCDICDDNHGVFHPIDDMVYPLHVNCICGWYEVHKDEVVIL